MAPTENPTGTISLPTQNKINKPKFKTTHPTRAQPKQQAPMATAMSKITAKLDQLTKALPKGTFSKAGSFLGGNIAGPTGAMVGKHAGDLLSRITGRGSYSLRRNSITADGGQIPTFSSKGDGITICHREFIQDIVGSTGFVNAQLPINPGQAVTFPWLSSIASQFEEYQLLGLVFEFRPSSGSYAGSSASAALGVVVYATQYNVNQPVFSTKQQMESYEYSTSTVPFTSMIHGVECAPHSEVSPVLLMRPSFLPDGGTLELYDHGTFNYATSGMAAPYTLGELWVSYHVRLLKPRMNLYADPTQTALVAHYRSAPNACSSGAPFGGSGLILQSGVNSIILPGSLSSFNVNVPGLYLLSIYWGSATTLTSNPTLVMGSNITQQSRMDNSTAVAEGFFNTGKASHQMMFNVIVAGTGTPNLVQVTGLAGLSSGNCDLFVAYCGPVNSLW